MKNLIHTAVITLFAASAAHAQQAVQWRVSDGGNGHWYRFDEQVLHWQPHLERAVAQGASLACVTSQQEWSFMTSLLQIQENDVWIGAISRGSTAQPPLTWVSGEPFDFSAWCQGGGNPDGGYAVEICGRIDCPSQFCWNIEVEDCLCWPGNKALYEWSADCNNDGIVDYGQCYDGTLPDYNGNDIPDCCEQGTTCVPGRYPVQWRVTDGGNGHWYGMHAINQADMTWMQMREAATRLGGHLITLSSAEEDAFGFRFFAGLHEEMMAGPLGYFVMPGGQWESVTGEPISYSNWRPAMAQPPLAAAPDNGNTLHRFATWLDPSWGPVAGSWEDWQDSELGNPADPISRFLIEWDADCNNDGVVDYGQILLGQIVDTNTNGIPDICEGPTCNDIDLNLNGIVDGGDLGILLAFWGPVSPAFPRADINRDGVVNGADLGIVLAFWGPCPN